MARAPLFGVFILALCLVACVCAHGAETDDDAKTAAGAAQVAATRVLATAKAENEKLTQLLQNVGTYKENADAAVKEAENAAKTNKEIGPFVQKAKDAAAVLLKLQTDTSTGVPSLVNTMKGLHTRATESDTEAQGYVTSAKTKAKDATAKKSADDLKTKVEALEKEIEAEIPKITTAQTAATKAKEDVEDVKKKLNPDSSSATNPPDSKPNKEAPISEETRKTDAPQVNDNKVNPQGTTGSPASGDSAMTVSVPLLMALIACAALQ